MASTVLSHSIFSALTSSSSPISKKSAENAPSFSVSFKQPLCFSRSHVAASHFNMPNKSFVVNSTADESSSTEIPIELKYPAFPSVMDINQIRSILPHRFPFLLVDRVIEYTPGVSAVAIKNVTINDNFFPGHFPERPIMPGVLMVEAMAQVGGLVMLQPEVGGSRDNFFFAGVDKVRFRKPVIAGDTLVMRMNLVKLQKRFGIAKMEGKAYVGGEVVCEGEFLMAMGSE
ncbi:hypothetical protein ACS0TY_011685 [Phlomoides rotata]